MRVARSRENTKEKVLEGPDLRPAGIFVGGGLNHNINKINTAHNCILLPHVLLRRRTVCFQKSTVNCLAVFQRCIFFNIAFLCFRLSGFMLPSPIVSSGSILALWFTTDFAVSAQGFKAVYEGKTMCECA